MEKTKLSPDPIRDAPKGCGTSQSPGPTAVLPGRSIVDERFNRFPMSLRVLAFCCGHAKTYTATFFVNQRTMATKMNCTQQAVSKHMRRLVEFGYLEKLRREDNRREWGKQGALWRVIFDPRMSFKQVISNIPSDGKSEEDEVIEMTETMDLASRGPKGHLSKKKPVDNFKANNLQVVDIGRGNNPQVVLGDNPQVVHKHQEVTIRREVSEKECVQLCGRYSQEIEKLWGKPWRYDDRQVKLAEDILNKQDVDAFIKDASKLLGWMRSKSKQPVMSLQYFIVRRDKPKEPRTAQEILAKVTNRMKAR